MSSDGIQSTFSTVLLYLQVCLGIWQFMKLTPVGALIKGVFWWLLGQLGLSRTYDQLRVCPGKVFKKANCFVLQADIPPERSGIAPSNEDDGIESQCSVPQTDITAEGRYIAPSIQVNRTGINLDYLGRKFVLEKKEGKEGNGKMLFVDQEKSYYYITDMIWKELQNLERFLDYGLHGPPIARAAVVCAAADRLEAQHEDAKAKAQHADVKAQHAEERIETAGTAVKWNSAYYNVTYAVPAEVATDARAAAANYTLTADDYVARTTTDAVRAVEARRKAAESARTAANDADMPAIHARDTAKSVKEAAASRVTLFVKGQKDFWKETITGGVMTLDEVMDAIILYNQHVSVRLSKDLLLPINLSVSEERLLKIVNLVALFLQTKKVVKVHWSIPIALSLISALLEFSTTIRARLYSMINVFFCSIMHLMCDPLPRSWRRHVYSLGKWVENLTPSNDIQLKVVRGKICAIITEGAKVDKEGAKVDKEGAIHVPWFQGPFRPLYGLIEEHFPCDPIGSDIRCTFVIEHELCEISAPTISLFYVKCKNEGEFRKIITLVKLMAEKCCGSLISCEQSVTYKVRVRGFRKIITLVKLMVEKCCGSLISSCEQSVRYKVRVRGFEQSVTSFVDNGFPSVYTLDLENVIVA